MSKEITEVRIIKKCNRKTYYEDNYLVEVKKYVPFTGRKIYYWTPYYSYVDSFLPIYNIAFSLEAAEKILALIAKDIYKRRKGDTQEVIKKEIV